MKTDDVKKLPAARSLLYGTRLDREEVDKPVVAIIYAQNEITPGHLHLNDLADSIKLGIAEAGGYGVKMNAGVGVCDGIAMGHDGMKYSLPSRELNRDCAIDMVLAHGIFSGIVFIGACDKNIPGYLMAAASLKLPTVFVTTGPMSAGCVKSKSVDVIDSFAADAQYALNKIKEDEYNEILESSCPTPGSCAGLFTANSMACVAEALGLTVPGMASALAMDNKKYRLAKQSGRLIIKLIKDGVTCADIMTEEAFNNALKVDMAIGASTNTILHVPAIAKEAGFDFDLNKINDISKNTPNILRLSPASPLHMSDLDSAGGIPMVMKRIESLLDTSVKTVNGVLNDTLDRVKDVGATNVIKDMSNPFSKSGGIAVYRGDLAPLGAVIKESGVDPKVPLVFEGVAKVFNDEGDATEYIKAGKVVKGDIIIIRYEGPAGGPGMREMLYPTSAIKGLGLDCDVALITDGRFSGGTAGICIGHVEPESYNGGPLAFLENGDEIIIDRDKKEINLKDKSILEKRKENFKPIEKDAPTRLLQNFRNTFKK